MRRVESLNTEKFKNMEKFRVKDTSKLYAGTAQLTQHQNTAAQAAQQGAATSWDSMPLGSNTNFNSDGGVLLGPVTTSYVPAGMQAVANMVN